MLNLKAMIEILNSFTNPYFNTALEEYYLKNFEDNCFIVWQNSPSVIVGKHQNAYSEIDYSFINENKIDVVRRITGGGAVYHDLGNINYSFITKAESTKKINFALYLEPIKNCLNKLGLDITTNTKNGLYCNNKKIGGTAAHLFKDKTIHHGTLLFSANLSNLEMALVHKNDLYFDKSIKSVHDVVTNIVDEVKLNISIGEFKTLLVKNISDYFNVTKKHKITNYENLKIKELENIKYRTWEWNFGYSPDYTLKNTFTKKGLTLNLNVKNGKICNIELKHNNVPIIPNENVIFSTINHSKNEIEKVLLQNVNFKIYPFSLNDLLKIFF